MKRIRSGYIVLIVVWLTFVSGAVIFARNCSATETFPVYRSIRPNVAFWKRVFTKYDTTDGIIHDTRNPATVYGVIKLVRSEFHNSRKINKGRIKAAKKKYKGILEKLSGSAAPSTKEARRVAALFGKNARRNDFQEAQDSIRCQVGMRDRFRKSVIRSGVYLKEIQRIFRSYALPEDLSHLPHVESSFNPRAYSRRGAAGIWQFTLSTGKRFMEVGYTVDERWDPIRSSHAAARYLKESYKLLGDWPMAITAYNHGRSGMLRAKKSKGGYESIFKDYRGRSFKFASRNFYSEFLAARDVAKNYKKHFGELSLARPLKSRQIVLKGYVPIEDLARHFHVDLDSLRFLNPSLRAPVFDGQKYVPKGYVLRLPVNAETRLLTASPDLPERLYKPRQKRSRFYRVRKGDTAGKIAMMHGVLLSELMQANHLDSKARIYARQNLRIPAPYEKNRRIAKAPAVQEKKNRPTRPGPHSKGGALGNKDLISKTGSERSDPKRELIPEKEERSINTGIVSGDFLVERVLSQKGKRVGIIRVEAAETLGHYADWLGVTTKELRRLNGFKYGKRIHMNEPVKIPLDKISKEKFEEKRFEYHKEMEEDFFASFRVKDVEVYRIKDGDNLWTLCHEVFDLPFWLIDKYNPHVNFKLLNPSQKLLVPLVEASDKG